MAKRHTSLTRRSFIGGAASALATPAVFAQSWPSRSFRVVLGFPPGGTTDLAARALANGLNEKFGVPAVVENKPGAGTLIAIQNVQHSAPDGYTMLLATNALVNFPVMTDVKPYDTFADFTHISIVSVQPIYVVVRASLGVGNISELIALAKKQQINFASTGLGTGQHIAGEMLAIDASISMKHVPYRGTGLAMADLISDRVDMMVTGLSGLSDEISAGRLRVIASTGAKRASAYPDVPTVAETGVPNYQFLSWQGVVVAKDTPSSVVDSLNAAVREVGSSRQFSESLSSQFMQAETCSPEEMRARLQQEQRKVAEIVRRTGIRMPT